MYQLVIIDDEEKIADGIAQLFPWQSIGFEVAGVFTDARIALQHLEQYPADVVMTDIEMPGMNGVELSRRLMAYPQMQKVFFSSYDNYEYFRAALQTGVVDYLMKPVNYAAITDCFEKVKERLDQENTQAAQRPTAYYEQILYDVTQYVRKEYRTATLEEAAQRVYLSPSYLSRIFKEKNGEGFAELLLRTRMEKACEMLGDCRYRSYDIAFYLGYDNPKSFSRAFRSFYQMSPSEYRRSRQGQGEGQTETGDSHEA